MTGTQPGFSRHQTSELARHQPGGHGPVLDEQLARLATDHIDFYLLHGLGAETWENLSRLGVLEFLDRARADGRIRYPAFSFHDSFPVFKEIVDAYAWTFAQIQYNYMDEQYQAGTQGLEYAAERGLGIVVMEPPGAVSSRGTSPQSASISGTPRSGAPRRNGDSVGSGTTRKSRSCSPACRQWSRSGRTLPVQSRASPGSLSPEELAVVDAMRDTFASRVKIPVHRLPLLHAVRTWRRYPLVLHVLQPGVHL